MAADSGAKNVKRGHGSDERPLARVLWSKETYKPNDPLLSIEGEYIPDNRSVDYSRYYSQDYFQKELEKVWQKTWLYACRDEDIPEVGDRVPLEVGPLSYFIVRTGADEFKAYYNSCLHRGTKLCAKKESSESIRCPYHAWEWHNDGRLKTIPSHWDFPEITRANGGLPEVKLGRWGGFIFINADPDAAPLEDALGLIPEHFKDFVPERRYTAARFRKRFKANWKVSQEAFMEAYHLYSTHPEAVPFNGDSQTQYDLWPSPNGHVGRNAGCSAVPSMHADSSATALNAGAMFAQAMIDWHYPGGQPPEIDPNASIGEIRARLGAWHRSEIKRVYGRDMQTPDAVMMDSMLYFMFPHICFWLSESLPFTYRFTPHATEPEQSYFEVRMLLPSPDGRPAPPSSPVIELGPDDSILKNVPAFGFLGYVFDQDMSNLPLVQRGMHAADPAHPRSRLGVYQEILIQHWNAVLDEMIARP